MARYGPDLSRRGALGALGIAAGLNVVPRIAAAATDPVVETRWGKVRGVTEGVVHAFKGVRYGASTAGANRFMPPRCPQPWAGIAQATDFGPMAPQSNPSPPGGGRSPIILGQIPRVAAARPAPPPPAESEDCLFLNVWTPGLDRQRKRPVMVWLHGGFFRVGSGGIDGSRLAARCDVVVVSLNHRLNILGYNHLADLAGPDFAQSGNVGMLDIVAALEWVRDNIEAFGGDPERVMVFGDSGGGMKTSFLVASPAVDGLIHRAGIQSGPGVRMMEREDATLAAELALDHLGIPRTNAADLQKVPTSDLLRAFHAVSAALRAKDFTDLPTFAPVIDPELLPQHPFSPGAAPLAAKIPMLIGWNREGMSFFMGNDLQALDLSEAQLAGRTETLLGNAAEDALEFYRELDPAASPSRTFMRIVTDREMTVPTLQQASRHAAAGDAGTWLFRMDWPSPAFDGKIGASHTIEADFVFNDIGRFPEFTGEGPAAQDLSAKMSEAWVNFAATGVPAAQEKGLPHWPAFDSEKPVAMVFDETCRVEAVRVEERLRVLSTA